MTVQTVFQHITFTSFVLFTFFAVLQLALKNKLPLNYYLAALFFAGGYEFFYYWLFSAGLLARIPALTNTEISASFLIGPFFYLYLSSALGWKMKRFPSQILHFLPFAIVIILIIISNWTSSGLFNLLVSPSSSYLPDYSVNKFTNLSALCSDISIGTYFSITFIRTMALFKGKKVGTEIKILRIFILIIIIGALIFILADTLNRLDILIAGVLCFTILPLYYILFFFRYPEFSLKVLKEAKRISYEKSIVKNINLDLVINRLTELMEDENLYAEEKLNLNLLSKKLGITPHQLSNILNNTFNKNFRTYINEYRIREAKRLLHEKPDSNILEISFSVGFNSKSAFYTAFQRETGCLPAEYRKKMQSE